VDSCVTKHTELGILAGSQGCRVIARGCKHLGDALWIFRHCIGAAFNLLSGSRNSGSAYSARGIVPGCGLQDSLSGSINEKITADKNA